MSATKANRLVLAASDSCHRDKNLTDGTPFIQGFRKLGALTLELAYTACGRIDGIVALPPFSPWDIAAGALMIAESGGIITDSQGEPITNLLECPSLVASHQHSHRQIIQWLNQGN